LTVVGYKGLTNGVTALDELLKDVECRGDDLRVTSVQSGLDGDDKLRDNRENLSSTVGEQIIYALHSQEPVWVLLLTDTFHEDGQVVMVVELADLNLPCKLKR